MKNERIGEILSRRINALGLKKQFTAARVCALSNEAADGEFEAVSFKNGVLKIRVSSNARAHLLKLRENALISKINAKIPSSLVEKLRFEID